VYLFGAHPHGELTVRWHIDASIDGVFAHRTVITKYLIATLTTLARRRFPDGSVRFFVDPSAGLRLNSRACADRWLTNPCGGLDEEIRRALPVPVRGAVATVLFRIPTLRHILAWYRQQVEAPSARSLITTCSVLAGMALCLRIVASSIGC
jgi:hypothetical protein